MRVTAGFVVGMATYQLSKHTSRLERLPFLGSLVVVAIVCWLALDKDSHLAVGITLFAMLILVLAGGTDWLCLILGKRVVVYLGEVSYSVYMVHWVVRVVVRTVYEKAGLQSVVPPVVMILVYSICTIGSAVLLYHLVERPWRSRLRTVLARRTRPTAAVTS